LTLVVQFRLMTTVPLAVDFIAKLRKPLMERDARCGGKHKVLSL